MSSAYYEGPRSDHFDGERFHNSFAPTVDRGLGDIWRWRRQRSGAPWPALVRTIRADHPPRRVDGLRIALVGHATLLVQVAGCNILIDPVWSERASPVGFAGPRRHQPPGIGFDELPPVDVVLITHSHYDHMDVPTLKRLWRRDRPRILAPLGNDVVIRRAAEALRVEVGDWWDAMALTPEVSARFCPANHWSSRMLIDRRRALWCGYLLETPFGTIYIAGDSAFGEGALFSEIGRRFGAPLVAVLPIGAYEPRWFMASQHMNPEEAVEALVRCGAAHGLGVHWGCFRLTDEAQDAPPAALARAGAMRGMAPARFRAMRAGEIWQPEGAVE